MSTRVRCLFQEVSACLASTVGGAGHSTRWRKGFELELRPGDGLIGRGEASPLPKFSWETHEQVRAELTAARDLELAFPDRPSECREFVLDAVARAGCTLPSTRFAFEGALLDLQAQRLELPMACLIERMLDPEGRNTGASCGPRELELSTLLVGATPSSLAESAQRAVRAGYGTVKIKLGTTANFDAELSALAAVRAEVGSSIRLRLDPNQAWETEVLTERLARVASFAPEFVEEPAEISQLVRLAGNPVPLAIDESLRNEAALELVAMHKSRLNLRAMVIKPALLGLLRAVALAEHGRHLGLDVVITHLFDGPIGLATAASFALGLGQSPAAHGLAPHPGLQVSPHWRVLGMSGGRLRKVAQPGLPLARADESSC